MKLVLVESPTKSKTLQKFLGSEYSVLASYGHIRDLPTSKLGVDVENNFEPQYVIPARARPNVKKLKEEAAKANSIILATDEDREGEAIAWHLVQALGLNAKPKAESRKPKAAIARIVFHEITKKAIEEALKNPRDIDMKRVDAQQARRILDRLVGYKLSPFLWSKVYRGLSAGRVQSVAVRLIVEREREIQGFKAQEYWNIEALLQKGKFSTSSNNKEKYSSSEAERNREDTFSAILIKIDGKTLDKFAVKNSEDAEKIVKSLEGAEWIVENVEKKAVSRNPLPPFTTSTLQQEAFRRLGFSSKQTMMIAQQLYEGVELGKEGATGLCVDENTLVIGNDGSIHPIKALEGMEGVKIAAIDEKTLCAGSTKVTKFWKIKAPPKILHVSTDDHEQIQITKDHPLMVLRRGIPTWIHGEHLKVGDFIASCASIPVERASSSTSLVELLRLLPKEQQDRTTFLLKRGWGHERNQYKTLGRNILLPFKELLLLLDNNGFTESTLAKHYRGVRVSTNGNAKFQKIPLHLTPEVGYFIGLIIGDGHLGERLSFSVTSNDKKTLNELNDLISRILGVRFQKFSPARNNYHVDSTTWYHLLQILGAPKGKKSHRIDIPNILLTQPDQILQAYLAGLWDTDGSIDQNHKMGSIRLSYSSKSEVFIDKLRLLLKTFGMNSAKHFDRRNGVWWLLLTSSAVLKFSVFVAPYLIIRRVTWDDLFRKYGNRYNASPVSYDQRVPGIAPLVRWTLEENNHSLFSAGKAVGIDLYNYYGRVSVSSHTRNPFVQKALLSKISVLADTSTHLFSNLSRSEVVWKEITQIKYKNYKKPYVFDITTNTSTFIANGLVSHNCTYMRTDSVAMSEEALQAAHKFIQKSLGNSYTLTAPRRFKTNTKGAQEAHEAIRPTDPSRTPDSIKNFLDRRQYRLYDLIWRRFIATQMPPAIFDATGVDIAASQMYTFKATGQVMKFDGFLKIYPLKFSENELPPLEPKEELELKELKPLQHFTQPPARFSEATLVKVLEQYGIGRPSTYAPIISTIQGRGYVERFEKRTLKPTETGFIVNDLLVEHFPEVVDINFTAKMEEELDEVAMGEKEWQPVIREFYEPFAKHLSQKYDEVKKHQVTETTEEICEKCGKPMVIRLGRFGKFLACSGFPECKNTKTIRNASEEINMKCPKCGEPPIKDGRASPAMAGGGDVVVRRTKRRKIFYGCSRYPDCDFASWTDPRKDQTKNV